MTMGSVIRRPWMPDVLLALALALLAGTVGYREMAVKYHCQNCIPDLLYPCFKTLGFTPRPVDLEQIPEYRAFWAEKLTTIPCEAVAHLPLVELGTYFEAQRYLHAAQSALLLLTGPRFEGIWLFLAGMYAVTALAAFGLFRLGMGRAVAAAMTVALIYAPFHIHNLITPADYAKAPFAVLTLFCVGVIVKGGLTRRALAVWSLLAGVSAGIGVGFKPDLMVTAVLAAASLVLFSAPLVDDGRWRRSLAVALFAVGVVAAGAPVLKSHLFSPVGSLLPVQVLGGMARGHDDTHAAPSPYNYGVDWDDSWVTFQINSYDQRVRGAEKFANFLDPQLTKAATALVVALDSTFPADRVLRVFGAVLRVLGLVPFGLLATAIVLAALFARNLRWALFVSFVLLTFVGYVSLIFQSRHYFHLLAVPLWMVGFVIHHGGAAAGQWWRSRQAVATLVTPNVRGVGALAAGLTMLVVMLIAARAYQQSRVVRLIESYNQEPNFAPVKAERRTVVNPPTVVHPLAPDGTQQWAIDLHSDRPTEGPDALALASTYLVVDVECLKPVDTEITRAFESPSYWRHGYPVGCSTGTRNWRLFLPVYESGPRWRFSAIEWPADGAVNVRSVRRIADPRTTPLMIVLVLPENWRELPFYHQLSWAALEKPQQW